MKNVIKLATISAATLLLAGCFSVSRTTAVGTTYTVDAIPLPAKEYVLSGDFLFDFDKSTLTSQGKSTLDRIASEIQQSGTTNLTVTGYTDRLGSAKYNQKLSERRANAAKSYLQSQGVNAHITAVGRGKANQVVACQGERGQALKDCLKPNRRVVINVN